MVRGFRPLLSHDQRARRRGRSADIDCDESQRFGRNRTCRGSPCHVDRCVMSYHARGLSARSCAQGGSAGGCRGRSLRPVRRRTARPRLLGATLSPAPASARYAVNAVTAVDSAMIATTNCGPQAVVVCVAALQLGEPLQHRASPRLRNVPSASRPRGAAGAAQRSPPVQPGLRV
jgi:hypothetical protein